MTPQVSLDAGANDTDAVSLSLSLSLTGHTVMFWLHWLMLELSSRVVQRRCFRSQPQ